MLMLKFAIFYEVVITIELLYLPSDFSIGGAIASIFTTEMRLDHPHIVTTTVTIGGARALSKEVTLYVNCYKNVKIPPFRIYVTLAIMLMV